jgi:hypothetical protein
MMAISSASSWLPQAVAGLSGTASDWIAQTVNSQSTSAQSAAQSAAAASLFASASQNLISGMNTLAVWAASDRIQAAAASKIDITV